MLNIKKARSEDVAYITEMSCEVFSDLPDIAPEDFTEFRWYYNAFSNGYLFNIMYDGGLIGFLAVFRTSRFCYELDRIYIDSSHRGLGLGKKTLNFLFHRFPEAKVWYADVKDGQDSYSSFLSACGFVESGFSQNSYTRYVNIVKSP